MVEQLWSAIEADPALAVTVDLENRQITAGDLVAEFDVDDYVRWRLMEGLDDIGITMTSAAQIDEFEREPPGVQAHHHSGDVGHACPTRNRESCCTARQNPGVAISCTGRTGIVWERPADRPEMTPSGGVFL